jgi:uncharacterized membrane protein
MSGNSDVSVTAPAGAASHASVHEKEKAMQQSIHLRSLEDQFELARHRYLRGLISDAEFYAAHRALREAKANGN